MKTKSFFFETEIEARQYAEQWYNGVKFEKSSTDFHGEYPEMMFDGSFCGTYECLRGEGNGEDIVLAWNESGKDLYEIIKGGKVMKTENAIGRARLAAKQIAKKEQEDADDEEREPEEVKILCDGENCAL